MWRLRAPGARRSSATTLSGAGSSFVSPLVSTWTPALGSAFDYTIQYSPTGSGAGITAITNRQVDFGASDAPLTPDQFSACNGCVQIPWALAGTAMIQRPGLELPKNTNLNLSGNVIAKIYMGEITNWSDAAIKKLNPKATLPDMKITPVYRTGNSGTTYNFTDYLVGGQPVLEVEVRHGQAVNWPTGIGANGSAGVAGVVANTPGALCYVDTAFAIANKLPVRGDPERGRQVHQPEHPQRRGGRERGHEGAGEQRAAHRQPAEERSPTAYPIATYTYVILPTKSAKAAELRKMVFWALTQGQKGPYTAKLWFSPIPKVVLVASEKTLKNVAAT